jgi:histidinol dehydrogenase
MVRRLDTSDPGFEGAFEALQALERGGSDDVSGVVRGIIADVRARGDAALHELNKKFDAVDTQKTGLAISKQEIADGVAACSERELGAMRFAAKRIHDYHARQIPADETYTDDKGVTLGCQWRAVSAAGLYVPGGTASYPSSVLMNAMAAKAAGVPRLVMVVPAPDGKIAPLVLAAADLAGVDEIYRVGGAQAIAALAYGTETIRPVDIIVGPGNAYVAAAKREVFGRVGIDMIAGPSEILVVADGTNDPDWIAADLLAQSEHDALSQSILITSDAAFGSAVEAAVERQLGTLPREDIARAAWEAYGAIITVASIDEALPLVDAIAPEHLELALDEPEVFGAKVRNAGAIFLGRHTPEAIGDYVAGTNHVLPTDGSARFSSGLSALTFLKRTSLLGCDPAALSELAEAGAILAEVEGLHAHRRSISIRTNRGGSEG